MNPECRSVAEKTKRFARTILLLVFPLVTGWYACVDGGISAPDGPGYSGPPQLGIYDPCSEINEESIPPGFSDVYRARLVCQAIEGVRFGSGLGCEDLADDMMDWLNTGMIVEMLVSPSTPVLGQIEMDTTVALGQPQTSGNPAYIMFWDGDHDAANVGTVEDHIGVVVRHEVGGHGLNSLHDNHAHSGYMSAQLYGQYTC